MSEDEQKILAGYSPEMLASAIDELTATVMSGRAGDWEKERRAVLKAESERRKLAARESEKKAA